ncbi:acyl carrier protein [Micromonospora sp. NPDC005215]|jgi:acyl carrier protein|uniref:acyl carrier protein n=1 Tax=unclassified Micromonospora TaxID=2617518 RepID=UPI0033A3A9F6
MSQNSQHSQVEIEEFVREQVEAMGADAAGISTGATLEEMGLDSLDVVELSQGVRKELGIQVRPNDFAEVKSLADALQVIYERAGCS